MNNVNITNPFQVKDMNGNDLPMINWEEAAYTVGGDQCDHLFLIELLHCYFNETLPKFRILLDSIHRYQLSKDYYTILPSQTNPKPLELILKDFCHALKGSAANLGLWRIAKAAESIELPFKAIVSRGNYTIDDVQPLLEQFTRFTYDTRKDPPSSFDQVATMEEVRFLVREFGALAEFLQHDLYTFLDSSVNLSEEFAENNELVQSLQRNKVKEFETIVQPYVSFLPDAFMYMPHATDYSISIAQSNILRKKYEHVSSNSSSTATSNISSSSFSSSSTDPTATMLHANDVSSHTAAVTVSSHSVAEVGPSLPGYIPPSSSSSSSVNSESVPPLSSSSSSLPSQTLPVTECTVPSPPAKITSVSSIEIIPVDINAANLPSSHYVSSDTSSSSSSVNLVNPSSSSSSSSSSPSVPDTNASNGRIPQSTSVSGTNHHNNNTIVEILSNSMNDNDSTRSIPGSINVHNATRGPITVTDLSIHHPVSTTVTKNDNNTLTETNTVVLPDRGIEFASSGMDNSLPPSSSVPETETVNPSPILPASTRSTERDTSTTSSTTRTSEYPS